MTVAAPPFDYLKYENCMNTFIFILVLSDEMIFSNDETAFKACKVMDVQENQTSLAQKPRILNPIQIHQLVYKIKLEICSIPHIFGNFTTNP